MSLRTAVFFLHIVNVIVHSFGSFVLTRITRKPGSKPQFILLLCLSITESVMNLLEATGEIWCVLPQRIKLTASSSPVFSVISTISLTGCWLYLYYVMHWIVIDRLLVVLLGLEYARVGTKKKTTRTMLIGAIVALLITGATVAADFLGYHWKHFYFKGVYNIMHISFISLSVSSYGYIFYAFQESQKQFGLKSQGNGQQRKRNQKLTAARIFKGSKFYISILLVSTYILFLMIPDLVFLFQGILKNNETETLENACWLVWAFGNFIDFIIYLLMPPRVKNELKLIFACKSLTNT